MKFKDLGLGWMTGLGCQPHGVVLVRVLPRRRLEWRVLLPLGRPHPRSAHLKRHRSVLSGEAEMGSGPEEGSYLRLIDLSITQL